MSDDAAAEKAIAELHGGDVEGRTIKVMVAKPREDKPQRGNNPFRNNGGGYNSGDSYNKNRY